MRAVRSFLWSLMLWMVFITSLVGSVAGAKLLDVEGTEKQLISYGSIVVSLVAGSLLSKVDPLKSILASRKVQWFLFLFNAAVAVGAYFLVDGPKGIGVAVGMGLVALGAGFGLLKRPAPRPAPQPVVAAETVKIRYEMPRQPQRRGRHASYTS